LRRAPRVSLSPRSRCAPYIHTHVIYIIHIYCTHTYTLLLVLSETKIGAKLHIPLGEERESVRAGHRGQEFWTIVGTMNAKASYLRR